jgi:hypothetical protein
MNKRNVFAGLGVSVLSVASLLACSSSSPSTSTSTTQDAATPNDAAESKAETSTNERDAEMDATEVDAATSDGGTDSASNQPEASACAPCPASYYCVAAPSGVTTTLSNTMDADGTCHVGGMTLLCGGTGTAANATALTWQAGSDLGPSGGAGIVVHTATLQLNCE